MTIRDSIIQILLLSSILVSPNTLADTSIQTMQPRCEYHENPLGIAVANPRLSWRLSSEKRGQKQTAYRILVASSLKQLEKNIGDLWDTGKVTSEQSIQIVYQGKALTSRQLCHWKVMSWDQNDHASDWSKPATWSMGLLNPSDWKAQWIGYDQVPDQLTKEVSTIVIKKALYGITGDPSKQVDVSAQIRQQIAAKKFELNVTNELAGKDPAPGATKHLELEYITNLVTRKRTLKEGAIIKLRTTPVKKLLNRTYLPSPHLRKDFQVKAPVKRAVVYVSAQGVVEMHLNGQRVSNEFYTPGWTDYRKRIYYRAYDVTNILKQGDNTIAGILGDGWFRGNISILGQNQYGEKLRLLSQLHIDYKDGSSEKITSDDSWKASFGPILQSDMQAGEIYDARRKMPGWSSPGFDDSNWTAVDKGSEIAPMIQSYPGVPVRPIMELSTVKVTEPQAGHHVFDMGQNFSGWIRLKVSGNAGDKLVMRFGEMLNPDGTVFTANLRSAQATNTYILKGNGEEIWEPHFTFHGFRYVEVTELKSTPKPDMITGIVVHSDAPMTSSFECSDPMLNQLHSNIIWGQRSNYLEVPTDCPQRDERLGWTGDTQVFIRSGTYHQDVASFFTKWLVDLEDTLNERNLYGKQAPVFHGRGSPGWSDAGIICPWVIYDVYGDTRVIEKHYDGMARYLKACGRNGLNGLGKGFGDWLSVGSKTPLDVISVAYYAYSTQLMAKMADAIGKEEDAKKYQGLFERIREHFQTSFVDANGRVKGNTQTAYCMALYYDLLTEAQRRQAADHLVERIKAKDYHLSVGFLGVPILLPTLTQIGRSDLAYRLLQNKTYPSWGYSVEQGATTVWERWDSYTKDKGITKEAMNSYNHYAYGACSEWMFRSILGIDTDGIAYKKIIMKPEVGHGVTWAKGHHDCILGRISSNWKVDNGSFYWKVQIPANTTATLYLPAEKTATITESGKSLEKVSGIKVHEEKNGRVKIHVVSGTYNFVVKK